HGIALHRRYYRMYGKTLHKFKLSTHITKLKKLEKYSHWKLVPSQAIQNIPARISFGYEKFFRKENTRPPFFRKCSKYKSFTLSYPKGFNHLGGNRIRIGTQKYKFFKSREILGKIKTLTIKRNPLGDFYLYFSCDIGELTEKITMMGKNAGFDFGLKNFITPSKGTELIHLCFLKRVSKNLKKQAKHTQIKRKDRTTRGKLKIIWLEFISRLRINAKTTILN
ncbi:MAG: putative transposase, partial [bacterium]